MHEIRLIDTWNSIDRILKFDDSIFNDNRFGDRNDFFLSVLFFLYQTWSCEIENRKWIDLWNSINRFSIIIDFRLLSLFSRANMIFSYRTWLTVWGQKSKIYRFLEFDYSLFNHNRFEDENDFFHIKHNWSWEVENQK